MTYLSSQNVHGECKGRVSTSIFLVILSKSLSWWILCSSRRGDGELSWIGAVAGTAIVPSDSVTKFFANTCKSLGRRCTPRTVFDICGLLGKFNSVQLLTHWLSTGLRPVTTTKKTRWRRRLLSVWCVYRQGEWPRNFSTCKVSFNSAIQPRLPSIKLPWPLDVSKTE